MGNAEPLGYSFLENMIEENQFGTNANFNAFKESLRSLEGAMHVFCLLDDEQVVEHLKGFIQALGLDPNKKVFVHVIFPQKSIDDYKRLIKILNKLNYDSLTQIKIGMIFGQSIIEQPERENELLDLGRMFFRGTGERWNELDKKLESLWNTKVLPRDAKGFCVTDGFSLHDNDMIFVFNYEGIDCDRLLQLISNPPMSITHSIHTQTLRFHSLFPLRTALQIPYIFETLTAEDSMAKALEQAGEKLNISIKVETNGQEGVKNQLTQDDIDHCTCIIVAADKKVEMQRFEAKKVIQVPVRDGISKAEELVQKANNGDGEIYHHRRHGALPRRPRVLQQLRR